MAIPNNINLLKNKLKIIFNNLNPGQYLIIAWGLLVFIPSKIFCQQSIVKDPDFTLYNNSPASAPIDFKKPLLLVYTS